ncbi:MAG: CPBP family intramembrane metalloprotease [Pseudonocardia sp.]|nr:CPBP family intramembrane metalloprotease [Pseudonocardia sp.]
MPEPRQDHAGPGPSPPEGPSAPPAPASPTAGAPSPAFAFRPPTTAPAPPHRWGLGAYLLAEAVFLGTNVLLVLPFYLRDGNGRPPAEILLLGLILPSALAAGVALLVTKLRGNGPRIDLGLRFERSDLKRGFAFGCGGLLLTIPAAALWSEAVGAQAANSAVGELFVGQRMALPLAIGVFLVVWLIAPVCEEILYRGLLWGAVRRHGADRWWAFGLTTLSFALAHFEFSRTPLLLVISIPIGLARLYTGRLSASIIAHQVNNLLPAVSLFFLLTGVLKG